jgi:hypothetical protein
MLQRLSILFVLILVCICAEPVRADSVTLTGGTASTWAGVGSVNLLGGSLSVRYLGEIPPGSTNLIGFNSATSSIGLSLVQFNGINSSIFRGALSFDNHSLSGSVTAYATLEDLFLNRSPLFTVTFSGAGFVLVDSVGGLPRTTFTVATPEPATLLLLLSGLAGAAGIRLRVRGKAVDSRVHTHN